MLTIKKAQDLKIEIVGELPLVTLTYYTDGQHRFETTPKEGFAFIPQTEMEQFADGQLKCDVHFADADGGFEDGLYHQVYTQSLSVCLR